MEVQVSGYFFNIFLIRQYLSCHGGPNFRICLFFFSFIYILVCFSCFLMFLFWAIHFLYWGSNFQDMFLIFNFMCFLYFSVLGNTSFVLGVPNFRIYICFISVLLFFFFFFVLGNTFFVLWAQISGYVFYF